MKLETEEPTHAGFASLGNSFKDPVATDAFIGADCQSRGIDEGNAGAGSKTTVQVGGTGSQHPRDQSHKAGIAQQRGEITTVVLQKHQVVMLERADVGGVKGDENGEDLTGVHPRTALPLALARTDLLLAPGGLKVLTKIVNGAKQTGEVHG